MHTHYKPQLRCHAIHLIKRPNRSCGRGHSNRACQFMIHRRLFNKRVQKHHRPILYMKRGNFMGVAWVLLTIEKPLPRSYRVELTLGNNRLEGAMNVTLKHAKMCPLPFSIGIDRRESHDFHVVTMSRSSRRVVNYADTFCWLILRNFKRRSSLWPWECWERAWWDLL